MQFGGAPSGGGGSMQPGTFNAGPGITADGAVTALRATDKNQLMQMILDLVGGGDQASSGGARGTGPVGGATGPIEGGLKEGMTALDLALGALGKSATLTGISGLGALSPIGYGLDFFGLASAIAKMAGVQPGFDPMLGAPTPAMVDEIGAIYGYNSPEHRAAMDAMSGPEPGWGGRSGVASGFGAGEEATGKTGTVETGPGDPNAGAPGAPGTSGMDPGMTGSDTETGGGGV